MCVYVCVYLIYVEQNKGSITKEGENDLASSIFKNQYLNVSLQELKKKQANFCINKKMELNTFSQFSHSVMADSF